jgi:hypothetical protein
MILALTASAVISACAPGLPSRAQSQTAHYVTQQTEKSLNQLRNSITFGVSKAYEELNMAYCEFNTANWDGFGALPVSEVTYILTEQFINALPLGTKCPTISAEPDGHLTMEWYASPKKLVSLSVDPSGMIHYAALIGNSRSYGSEPFNSKVPENIMSLIRKIPSA